MKKTLVITALFALFASFASARHIVVNLSQQRACAYEGNSPVFCGNISTGKPGHRTPTGRFRVLEKDIDHVSSKYPEPNGGAKMHYALRLTSGGIAMHLGYVPSYPASHGCIRMQSGFAQRMYSWAHVGTPVRVIGTPPGHVNRSAFSRVYGTSHRSGGSSGTSRRVYRANATDILREFMRGSAARPRTVHHNKRTTRRATRTRHSRRKRRTHRERHPHPLDAIAAR